MRISDVSCESVVSGDGSSSNRKRIRRELYTYLAMNVILAPNSKFSGYRSALSLKIPDHA